MRGPSWLTTADLMSGLMFVFLLISVALLVELDKLKRSQIILQSKVADCENEEQYYEKKRGELYEVLITRFGKFRNRWNLQITPDNTIRFIDFGRPESQLHFEQGKSRLSSRYKKILQDFFPLYIESLTDQRFKNDISEIRIEGHASSEWQEGMTRLERYIPNLRLSQERAREVLNFGLVMENPAIADNKDWLMDVLRSNGFSFSRPILSDIHGSSEDRDLSRRVEFRAILGPKERFEKSSEDPGDLPFTQRRRTEEP